MTNPEGAGEDETQQRYMIQMVREAPCDNCRKALDSAGRANKHFQQLAGAFGESLQAGAFIVSGAQLDAAGMRETFWNYRTAAGEHDTMLKSCGDSGELVYQDGESSIVCGYDGQTYLLS